MEWFEKYVHDRAYVWETMPGEETTEQVKGATTAQR